MGHGLLDFCRVKANFSARVPKNLGGPRPPQEVVSAPLNRGPRAESGGIFVPRVFALMTDHEGEGAGIKNLVLFAGRKTWRRICFWSNDATNMLIDLWSEETIQFALESREKFQRKRERDIALFG